MGQYVDAHHVGQAESAGTRPSYGGAGEGVGFLNAEPLLKHQIGCGEHDRDADAVGDEVGSVVGEDDLLPKQTIGEGGKRGQQGRVGFGDGDELEQAHVARGVEEVAAEEASPVLHRQYLSNLRNGQAGSVGGEQRRGAKVRQDPLQQRMLDGQIFSNGLNHPVALAQAEAGRRQSCRERCGPRTMGQKMRRAWIWPALQGRRPPVDCAGRPPLGTISRSCTGMPALARTAAIREPIVPAPSTAARRTSMGWAWRSRVGAGAGGAVLMQSPMRRRAAA